MSSEIDGIEGMNANQIRQESDQGGRFVIFEYTVSIFIMTFKRPTNIYFLRAGESAALKGLPWTMLSLFLGGWGFPWGFVYAPMAMFTNLSLGKDVTKRLLSAHTSLEPS
ncbi:MAG TPA: hypothetical protein PKE31_12575 [Pseudomonadota bacterium]|nr:hypothetical protein [Pseudomonadota bacterium]